VDLGHIWDKKGVNFGLALLVACERATKKFFNIRYRYRI
jgi:hypothetical protein